MASRLEIAERRIGDITILSLTGRLELEDGDRLFRDYVNRLVAEGRVKLVLDLKHVTRIDSAGLGMLISKYLSTRRGGGTIKLLNLTARSDHLLEITRLVTVFEIFDNEAEAVQSFLVAT